MKMGVMPSGNGLLSSRNPNAPMSVPATYRNVEDFSDQWWSLVRTSPFCDYWLRECSDIYDSFLPDDVDIEEDLTSVDVKINVTEGDKEKEVMRKDMILLKLTNWMKARGVESRRLYEKAPKIVNVKVSPRPIHQPR